MLIGQPNGTYAPVATSSLGISGGSGSSGLSTSSIDTEAKLEATLTGTDFDFDGGANPSGDLGGSWASPSVTDDSHAHTGSSLSGIDISSDTNLSGDSEIVLTGDALSIASAIARDSELHSAVTLTGSLDYITLSGQQITRNTIDIGDDTNLTAGDHITLTGDDLDVDDSFLFNTGDTGSGIYNFTGTTTHATSSIANLLLPNLLTFNSVTGNEWSDFCVSITGHADLCDGDDATGGGGVSFGVAGQVPFTNGTTDDFEYSTSLTFNGGSSELTVDGLIVADLFSASGGGDSDNWNTAFGWGNHADQSYLTGVNWGDIGGTLADQNDLQSALDAKQDTLTTGNLTEAVPGLEFDNTRQVIGGAAALSLSSGFTIPLGASTTEWATAYASTTALTPAYIRGLFSAGTGLSYSAGQFSVNQAANLAWTGQQDFGGASFLEIPNGAGPTADDAGEIAHDTSDNQLILDDRVVGRSIDRLFSFQLHASSTQFAVGATTTLPVERDGYTVTDIHCFVVGGTSKVIVLFGETITCGPNGTEDDGSIASGVVTALATTSRMVASTTSGAVSYLNVSIFGWWTRK